jgi:hypothetical protein
MVYCLQWGNLFLFKKQKIIKNMKNNFEEKPVVESREEQAYKKWREAETKEDGIAKEIEDVFESVPSRREAEKVVLEQWASLMDEAKKGTREALKEWLGAMEEEGQQRRAA